MISIVHGEEQVLKTTNEILIDVIETVDLIVSSIGKPEFTHIRGRIQVNSRLSDMPLCKLILSTQSHYEDTVYHRCVETDTPNAKVIPFYPPDGNFTLLKYRVTALRTTLPIWINPKFHWPRGGVSFDIQLKPEQTLPKPLENIEIRIELPVGVGTPSLIGEGRTTFDSSTREVVWFIPSYSKKEPISLKGSATTESGFELGGRFPTISCKFTTVGAIPSNFKVEKLDIESVDYKFFKGVKYITEAGNYEFRTGLL